MTPSPGAHCLPKSLVLFVMESLPRPGVISAGGSDRTHWPPWLRMPSAAAQGPGAGRALESGLDPDTGGLLRAQSHRLRPGPPAGQGGARAAQAPV